MTTQPPVLEVRNLSKQFRQGSLLSRRHVHALRDVSFDLGRGEVVSLVGESGSGKSTIARIIARLEQPTSGTFLLDGRDIIADERRRASLAYRRKVQMVFQDPFGSLNPSRRVDHFLERPLRLHGLVHDGTELREREIALMASPELYPGLGAPETAIEVKRLKRLMNSGPYTFFSVTNSVMGAMTLSAVRTNTLSRLWTSLR